MKILVTGVAGFIGSHMAKQLLQHNYIIVGIDNLSDYYDVKLKQENLEGLVNSNFKFIKLDLRYAEELSALDNDFDFIFHFAAQPGLSASSTFQSYVDNNIVATQNLIEFTKRQKHFRHFFYISTSSVYGKFANVTEDTIPKPISYYGVTKLAAEQLVLAQSRQDIFKASSMRLYSVYGPGERPDKMFSKLITCSFQHSKFPLYQGSLEHLRSFTFVGDIIKGLENALANYKVLNGEIINLGHYENQSTQEGILTVERLLKTHIPFTMLPSRQGDQNETRAIINKARILLNYQPRTSLEKGVSEQINWYKSKYNL